MSNLGNAGNAISLEMDEFVKQPSACRKMPEAPMFVNTEPPKVEPVINPVAVEVKVQEKPPEIPAKPDHRM